MWLYRVAILVGLALGVFDFAHGWPLVGWGGVAIGAAGGIGTAWLQSPWLLALVGAGLAAAIIGPAIWRMGG